MNNPLRTILIVSALLVLGIGAFLGGVFVNRIMSLNNGSPGGMMGSQGNGPGGMMNRGGSPGGMMQGYGYNNPTNVTPLSVEESEKAVQEYLAYYGNDDLVIREIMIFDNNAYAIIAEKSTGSGAFELVVDPVSKTAYPEYGPNMMWNQKYGMHAGSMMGGWKRNDWQNQDVPAEMPVTTEQAAQYAQEYLDRNQPGIKVSDEITSFYGYYTIDLEKDGQIVGMLSVNGYNGQVFPHTWHGAFIEMKELDEE